MTTLNRIFNLVFNWINMPGSILMVGAKLCHVPHLALSEILSVSPLFRCPYGVQHEIGTTPHGFHSHKLVTIFYLHRTMASMNATEFPSHSLTANSMPRVYSATGTNKYINSVMQLCVILFTMLLTHTPSPPTLYPSQLSQLLPHPYFLSLPFPPPSLSFPSSPSPEYNCPSAPSGRGCTFSTLGVEFGNRNRG